MRETHCASWIALLLAINILIGPQFINTVSGAEEESDFDDGVVEDLQVSGKMLKHWKKTLCPNRIDNC